MRSPHLDGACRFVRFPSDSSGPWGGDTAHPKSGWLRGTLFIDSPECQGRHCSLDLLYDTHGPQGLLKAFASSSFREFGMQNLMHNLCNVYWSCDVPPAATQKSSELTSVVLGNPCILVGTNHACTAWHYCAKKVDTHVLDYKLRSGRIEETRKTRGPSIDPQMIMIM